MNAKFSLALRALAVTTLFPLCANAGDAKADLDALVLWVGSSVTYLVFTRPERSQRVI